MDGNVSAPEVKLKGKERARERDLIRKYGITQAQYDDLLQRQGGCCGVCKKSADEFPRRLAVDHNHFTGEIRGLLCTYCNHRLIGRHRNSELLRTMADYLMQSTGWFVPKQEKKKKKRKIEQDSTT